MEYIRDAFDLCAKFAHTVANDQCNQIIKKCVIAEMTNYFLFKTLKY